MPSESGLPGVVVEREKEVPVAYDVDVAVAGAGIAGVIAAIASARNGATTVVIDRFGQVGGNMGPGLIGGGGIHGPQGVPLLDSLDGIRKEFCARVMDFGGSCHDWYGKMDYLRDSYIMSHVALQMLQEAGVEMMLSAYIADPIMDGDKVCGLFVECKSGRVAVKAKVVVDATGEADVARRAGAPILYPKYEYCKLDTHAPNGMGGWYAIAGVDWEKYQQFKKDHAQASEEDIRWADETLGKPYREHMTREGQDILPFVRKEWESGGFKALQAIDGLGYVSMGLYGPLITTGMVGCLTRVGIMFRDGDQEGLWSAKLSSVDGVHMSKAEVAFRKFAFEDVQFRKKYLPGFEGAYLVAVSPFLGPRGGPCIEGECIVGNDPQSERCDDELGVDGTPYRALIPKETDGLIAVGRSASSIPDTRLRMRAKVMRTAEAGGAAAALAARAGVAPRALDIRALKQTLIDAGIDFGDEERVKEMGLRPRKK